MAYLPTRSVTIDTPIAIDENNLDAFGRLRSSTLTNLFEDQNIHGFINNNYNTITSGTASVTDLPNESSLLLSIGTASGDRCLRESITYIPYFAGKSTLLHFTGVLGNHQTNTAARIGLYDDNDGLFFESTGGQLNLVRRTSTSGSPVDTVFPQSTWNIDKMDGTGPSGYTVDLSKTQIFGLDFQWLGVGRVRYFMVVDGKLIYIHHSYHANILTEVYMKTAWLPIRYELINLNSVSSTSTLKQICVSATTEGGEEYSTRDFSINNGLSAAIVSSGQWTHIFSIRLKDTINNRKVRGYLNISDINILNVGNRVALVYLVKNINEIPSNNWVSFGTDSLIEYSVDNSLTINFTQGSTVYADYLPAGTKGSGIKSNLKSVRINGSPTFNNTDTLSLIARPESTGDTSLFTNFLGYERQ